MKIVKGSLVKIILKNGMVESGKLNEHTSEQLILDLADYSVLIIQNPDENVIAIKVLAAPKKSSCQESVFVDVEQKPETYYRDETLRVKSLAQLHMLKANEERSRAKELLLSYKPTQAPEVSFGIPNLKSIPKHPPKKVRRIS